MWLRAFLYDMRVCLWLNPLYNFVLQAIQNEREIESLRKKLTFCVEAKENLERYNITIFLSWHAVMRNFIAS